MKESKIKKADVIRNLFSIYEKGLQKKNCNFNYYYKKIKETLKEN